MFFALLHTSVTWEMDNSVRPRNWEVLVMSALVSQAGVAWQVEHLLVEKLKSEFVQKLMAE